MRARHLRAVLLAIAGIALSATAACSIPKTDFQASSDGGNGQPDAPAQLSIVLSDNAIGVGEGASKDFTVALSRAPGARVTVQITSASKKIGITSPELVFDDGNFSMPQKETISGLEDPDTVDDIATIDVIATGVTGVDPRQVTATVHDNDTVALVTDAAQGTELDIDEGSQIDVRVHLSAQPTGPVVVSANLDAGPMWANPTTISFLPGDYDKDQVITFTAPKDANAVSEVQMLALRATGVPDAVFTLKDVDKDVLNFKTDVASLIVNEQGTAGTVQVSLTQQPTGDVQVALTTETGAVMLDQTTLTFTMSNYNQPQPVHVTGLADVDTIDNPDKIHLNATGIPERLVPITVHDDDVQAIVDDVTGTFAAAENATTTFDVWLAYKPQADVQVQVASMAAGVATANPGLLTFTAANYDKHQQVSVHGTDDANLVTNATQIQLTNASIPTTTVGVAVADDDHQAIVLTKTSSSILEPGFDTVSASLAYDPGGTVTLATTSHDVGVTATPSVAFDSTNYGTPKPITLTAVNDADANSIDTTVDVAGGGAPTQTISVHVTDKDTLGIFTDQTGTVVINEGQSVDIKVHLTAKPNASVTVAPQIPAGTAISVSPASAIFSTTTYGNDATFHFSAAPDANTTDEDTLITFHTATAGIADVSLTLHTQDKDKLGIVVDKTAMTLTEQGTPGTINVSLSNQPAANVTVMLSSSTGATMLGATQLTFTTSTWQNPQPVSISAPSDPDTVNGASVITLSATGITTTPTVSVTVIDDDTQAILTDATSLSCAEGGTTTFHVWLAFQPTGNTTIGVASLNASVATPSVSSVAFGTGDYNTHKLVTVSGTEDQNLITDNTKIRLTEATMPTVDLPTAVTDNDTQKIVLSTSAVGIPEGTSTTFDVSLQYDPGASVSVGLTSSNPAVQLGQASVPFTSATYSTPVHVTLTAPIDSNTASEVSTIKASLAGVPDATLTATAQDSTTIAPFGWPTYLGQSGTYFSGAVTAYKIHVDVSTTLDKLGLYAGSAGGDYRIALYRDGGNIPGALEVDSGARASISAAGTNQVDIVDHALSAGYYWIAFRVDPQASLGTGTAQQTGQLCARNVDLNNLDDPWPTNFGAASCATAALTNIFAITYHQ